jgi:hypothetical protein
MWSQSEATLSYARVQWTTRHRVDKASNEPQRLSAAIVKSPTIGFASLAHYNLRAWQARVLEDRHSGAKINSTWEGDHLQVKHQLDLSSRLEPADHDLPTCKAKYHGLTACAVHCTLMLKCARVRHPGPGNSTGRATAEISCTVWSRTTSLAAWLPLQSVHSLSPHHLRFSCYQ